MRAQRLPALAVLMAAALETRTAWAGMPSLHLADRAALRIGTISFFLVLLLLCAAVIRGLWNYLAKEFPIMPRLGYRKALALVVLVGLLLGFVLTMIAGARELLTPGAWQSQGVLYKLRTPASEPTPSSEPPQ